MQVDQYHANLKSQQHSDNKRENLNDHLGNINILTRPAMTASKGFFYGKGKEGNSDSTKTKGILGSTGETGIRILKGKRKRKKTESHRGVPSSEGKDIVVQKQPGGEASCPLKSVRVIKRGIGIYSVNFEIPHDVASGKIELVTVGENGKSNRIHITDVKPSAGCKIAELNNGLIETVGMSSSEKIKIMVTLADSHDYAMEVNVYEHNQ